MLPVFEVDCSDWLADKVPQRTGPIYQESVVVGPPDDDAPCDTAVTRPSDPSPAEGLEDFIEIVGRALRLAITEARRQEVASSSHSVKNLISATTRDFLQMAEMLEAARSRLHSRDQQGVQS